jgi:aspartate racemase
LFDAGVDKVALLGTKLVMATEHLKSRYQDLFGIQIIVPDPNDQDTIDQIIFQELCSGCFRAESRQTILDAISGLQARGAQGVILGCTEIPLLISQEDQTLLPMFDTAELHVAAAMRLATNESSREFLKEFKPKVILQTLSGLAANPSSMSYVKNGGMSVFDNA